MLRQTAKRLHDAATACGEARQFCAATTRAHFLEDRLTQLAVQKAIEIVGEALRKAEEDDPEAMAALPELRSVINTRNRLVHGYDTVDYGALWDIVQRHVPELERRLQALLQSAPPSSFARKTNDGPS
jgi:uncharacterized protein with HEPN domain